MKNLYKKLGLGLLLMVMGLSLNAQIHSTTTGGDWSDPITWVGGGIPGVTDDVVINGPVQTNTRACNNLTINASGSLRNDYYGYTLTVNGNLTNNGEISSYAYGFTLQIAGNIINNGIWTNPYTYPNGTADQTITCLNGNNFGGSQFHNNKPSGNIYFFGTVNYSSCDVFLSNADVYLQANSALNLHDGQFRNCTLYGSGSTSIVYSAGVFNVDATSIESIVFNNLTLDGDVTIYNGCSTHGTVTNNGFLQNDYYGTTLNLYDNFINYGTIRSYAYGFTLNIYGNISNNGVIENTAMDFRGEGLQQVSLQAGKTFSPTYWTSFKPTGIIEALTDLYFDNVVIDMNNDTLFLQDDATLSLYGGYLTEAPLVDADNEVGHIHLYMTNGANLNYSTIINPEILGMGKIGNGNTFFGEIMVTDTMQNDYYSYTLNILGNVTNNGIIQNNSGAFSLNISGNILNNGIWQNSYTYLNGTNDQHVTCLNGSPFTGYQFIATNSTGLIYFDTEVLFDNTEVRFEGNNLELPENSMLSIHGNYITNCNLHGNGPTSIVHGEGVYPTDGPYMTYSTIEDVKLTGDWGIGYDITMNGAIINEGVMQNAYYSYATVINADFINNGTIKSYSGGFTTQMYGNFTNNGNWAGHAIDLYGDADQIITLADGKIFNPTYFTSFKPSGNIIASTDLEFFDTYVNLEQDPLIMPDNSTLKIDGRYLIRGDISAETDRFNLYLLNGAYIDECLIHDANLFGTTNIGNFNSFYGLTINQGIMQNNYYTYAVDFYGDLINNVTIQNYSGGLQLYAHANITNNGTWTNYFTAMLGTTDQYIHLKNGHWITGQMRFITDVPASPYQWYLNGFAIVDPPYPQPPPFSGWDANTLVFNNPVTNGWIGTYNCLAGGTYSRNLFIDEETSMRLDITAILEGPYNGSTMNTDINSIIPLQQSLHVIGYEGPEAVAAIPNTDVVDWIGVELRDAPDISSATDATTVGGGAFFIKNDGSIVGLDGNFMLSFDLVINDQLFVVLWHRNHLPVISQYPLAESGGIYSYDFTTAASQAFADNQSDLGNGNFGMIGGNANGDGIINEYDGIQGWYPNAGQGGYLMADVNMDGQVSNPDKNDIWLPNVGKYEQLPGSGFIACGTNLYDDRDGQSYATIEIGTQCWMAENLNIGTMIQGPNNPSNNGTIEKYCVDNILANCDTYGGFYQWDEIMEYSAVEGSQGICPIGWHIPTDAEWCIMEQYLDPSVICGNTLWRGTDIRAQLTQGGTSGFEALAPGYRNFNGTFEHYNFGSYFWTSTQTTSYLAFCRYMWSNQTGISRWAPDQIYGYSVRCVLNDPN